MKRLTTPEERVIIYQEKAKDETFKLLVEALGQKIEKLEKRVKKLEKK